MRVTLVTPDITDIVPDRRCVVCGGDFLPRIYPSRQNTCSETCRRKRRVQYVTRYQQRNQEATRARSVEYHRREAKHYQELFAAWRLENAEARADYMRRWRREHPEKGLLYKHRRRALAANAGGTHDARDIDRLWRLQSGRCWWCSGKMVREKAHVDHRVPLSRGGSDAPDNLVMSCARCNQSKGSKMPDEFAGRLL